MVFFEGSEKKFEVLLKEDESSFRQLSRENIINIVGAAKAQILSEIHNDYADAYLLSESSLFVWDNRLTMITCGQTTLIHAVRELLELIPKESIDSFIYQRKNEYYPQMQVTDFHQDLKNLEEDFLGTAYRFGSPDEHHLYLYNLKSPCKAESSDTTLEMLMYDLDGPAKEAFTQKNQTLDEIHRITGINKLFEGFVVDDHVFEPFGYSLNAIKDDLYYTFHVTPQDSGPYVSFETNACCEESSREAIERVYEIFRPRSFDTVFFSGKPHRFDLKLPGFAEISLIEKTLESGYFVSFGHYANLNLGSKEPLKLL